MARCLRARFCFLSTAVLLLCQAPDGVAQRPTGSRRALTIEDYYRIQTVGNLKISPNGMWVAFSVSTRIEEDNSTRTETYLVSTDGTAKPWRVLHYGKDVTETLWMADNRLQYSAYRQQWSMNPDTPLAPPLKIERMPAGKVSPDGKWVAVVRDEPQRRRDPVYSSEFERRHEERFKGAIFDWKDFQRDGSPFPAPNLRALPAAQIAIRPVAGGEGKTLTNLDLRPTDIIWHPDGRLLAFIADSHWRDELKYECPNLWTVTPEGKVNRLTDDLYTYGSPDFSPDGRYLSYIRGCGTDMVIQQKLNHGGPRDLFVRPIEGGEPINLTAAWDLEPRGPRWSPDGQSVYFTAEIGGEHNLFRVSVPGGRVEQVTKGGRRLIGVSIDKSLKRMAYAVETHAAPPEVYVAAIDGTSERRLSEVHKVILAEIGLSNADRLHWRSYDGAEIEGWLLHPYGYDQARGPYPLIVTSHGGPHSATGYTFDFKKQYFAANGYFVLDTNFRGSTGYGEAFKWATWGEWGKKDGEDVVSGIDYVLKHYPIDPKRVGHTGHSYGGFMTNWLITQYPHRFAAAITGAGISNWISDYGTADIYRTKETEFYGTPWDQEARDRMIRQSPLVYAGSVKTPTLFVHGEVDQRVPYEEAEQMYFALKRRGIPAKMIQYAGQPHGIGGHWNNVHRMINELKWWDRYLKRNGVEGNPSSTLPASAK
jgi:dipeptidyl aminopeptidase/acylaminoacyl peptidase